MGKAAEKKKHVKLRVDMFILTFAIYGIMSMLAVLVFLIELKIGKRSVAPQNDEEACSVALVLERPITRTFLLPGYGYFG